MRKLFIFIPVLVLLVLSSSCSKTMLFTQTMRHQLNDHGVDLRDVQFYNSRKFILQRNLSYEEARVAQGKISFENGQFIEQIIIKKNTPGVCEEIEPNSLLVSFEDGYNRNIRFMINERENYQISALDWRNRFGRVSYDTTYYYIVPGGERTLLKVKKEDVTKIDQQQRVAAGRKVLPSNP